MTLTTPFPQVFYSNLYFVVGNWIRSGQLKCNITDIRHSTQPDQLDLELFKMHGMCPSLSENDWDANYLRFNDAVAHKVIDISWLRSPHAFTIFKAKAIKTGTFNQGADIGGIAEAVT